MEQFTIGQLAARVGVPTTTVRFYERSGLLRQPLRTASNYRVYQQDEVERLRFIRASQAAGLTLADIKALLEYRDGVVAPCREVRDVIEKRLAKVTDAMKELRHVRKVLDGYLKICQQAEQGEPCEVIHQLDAGRENAAAGADGHRRRKKESGTAP